jgi:hypothetical protein
MGVAVRTDIKLTLLMYQHIVMLHNVQLRHDARLRRRLRNKQMKITVQSLIQIQPGHAVYRRAPRKCGRLTCRLSLKLKGEVDHVRTCMQQRVRAEITEA